MIARRVGLGGVLLAALTSACGERPSTGDTDGPVGEVTQPLVWVEEQKLVPGETQGFPQFGISLALAGDVAVFGSFDNDAYVFTRTDGLWTETQKLAPSVRLPDVDGRDGFGWTVAASEDSIFVGAPQETWPGEFDAHAGAAYVFEHDGTSWVEAQRLTASDARPEQTFGWTVAVDGDTLLVTALGDYGISEDPSQFSTGAVYVFEKGAEGWVETQKLVASDGTVVDFFGYELSLDGDVALIGAWNDNDDFQHRGAAYVFERSDGVWTERQKIVGEPNEGVGRVVAASGETLMTNAAVVDGSGDSKVLVYGREGESWAKVQELGPAEGSAQGFSASIALAGDTALVGHTAFNDIRGAAYVFERSDGLFTEQQILTASDGERVEEFGAEIALSGRTAMIVARLDDRIGSGYAFTLAGSSGEACLEGADCHSGYCVEGVCCDSACENGCQSCLAVNKASGPDGECGDVTGDSDPRDACDDEGAASCGENGLCDGAAACAIYAADVECAAASCASDSSLAPAAFCDGAGSCVAADEVACAEGKRCENAACVAVSAECSQDKDCPRGSVCSAGVCAPRPADAECHDSSDCAVGSRCNPKTNLCEPAGKRDTSESDGSNGSNGCSTTPNRAQGSWFGLALSAALMMLGATRRRRGQRAALAPVRD
jgi:hypothetical protein